MTPTYVRAPYRREVLEQVAAKMRSRHRCYDDQHTVDWLLLHQSEAQIAEMIRTAWSSSLLPLRGWANSIRYASACELDERICIAVEIHGRALPVFQSAALDAHQIEFYSARLGRSIPPEVKCILAAAPGLSLVQGSCLLHPDCVFRPFMALLAELAMFERKGVSAETIEAAGHHAPRPSVHWLEVLTCFPCAYVLGYDQRIYWFDWYEPWMEPLSITLSDLVAYYFEFPEETTMGPAALESHLSCTIRAISS